MKKLLVYLKGYEKECILGPLFKLLEASFELIVPFIVAVVIDKGIVQSDWNFILKMCVIMVLLGMVGLSSSITAQYFAAKAAVGFATKLRHSLLEHIQKLSFTSLDKVGTSTLITRMTSDINQTQSGVNMVIRLFLRSPFIVFGAMIMAFTIHKKAGMVFLITIILLSIVIFLIMFFTVPLYKKVQKGVDDVLLLTRQNLTGARVIRSFHKEEEEFIRFGKSNDALTAHQLFAGKMSAFMNPVTYTILSGGLAFLVWTGAIQVDIGNITQGELVALISFMSQILVELVKFANLIVIVTKAVACGNRIQSILEIEPRFDNEEIINGLLEEKCQENQGVFFDFQNVSLTYKGAGDESLTDINFSVKKGETIGIIGSTGAGKSSLVNLLPRFYENTKGIILFMGQDLTRISADKLRKRIGIVMQKSVLFHGTIRENLLWGNEQATIEDLEEALRIAQAKEFVDKKEKGLEMMVEQGGRNLSGGQRQRLCIARALVRKPEILILDDSSSALDFATDAKLRKAIKDMQYNMTVFIVSQRTSSIMHADKILVLDDGKMVDQGTHQELLSSCSIYQEIYYSQFPKEVKV